MPIANKKKIKRKLLIKYYKYIKIFFLQNAKKLPPYKTYNYKIKLKLNAKLLYLRNRFFLLTEFKVIKK